MKQQEPVASVNMAAVLEDVKASDETDTTKTGSTPPSSSDTASSSSTLNDEPESPVYDDTTLGQLARQLEYYFSIANLEKDTYVETLRQLNDGYVPVSILQRFSKVQAFTPIETVDAIIKAATEFTSLLEVVAIDTKTGKRVPDDESGSGSTILAVGSTTGEPLDLTGLPGVVPTTPKSPVQNTIIIREVDSRVTEEEVRALFDDEHCPPIQSLYLDVFNCWFVTLDTTSRDDMLYVMMQLRSQYLGDEPVKARLKSLVRQVDPTSAPHLPILTPSSSYNHLTNLSLQESGGSKGNKRKQKKRTKNNVNNSRGNSQGGVKKNAMVQQKGNRDGTGKKADTQQQPKPDFSAASFPALADSSALSRKVEVVVDKDNMDSAPRPTSSDACSTATTLSSSSSSVTKGKQQLGGYAAALLKTKPAGAIAKVESTNEAVKESEVKGKSAEGTNTTMKTEDMVPDVATTKAQVVVKPPVWGGGRSFADVLAM